MLQLVRKLNARLTRKPAPAASTPSIQTPKAFNLPPKPGAQGEYWSSSEARLLMQWELEHRTVHVELPYSHGLYQTLVVGVDLLNNQLLLDAIFPAPSVAHAYGEQPFWLTLPLANGDYRVCVQPRATLPGRELLVDIVAVRFSPRAVPAQEMHFADNRSPCAQLRLGSGRHVSGRLRVLATGGATLAVPSSLNRDKIGAGEEAECTISFNERFAIQCRARVTHQQRSNGTKLIQLDFVQMDNANRNLLETYIRTCENQRG